MYPVMERTLPDCGYINIVQLFRLWLGVTEYLFRNQDLLDEALDTAIDDNTFRSDDLEFTFAARVCFVQYPRLLSESCKIHQFMLT